MSLSNKIAYTKKSIDDIELALQEQNIDTDGAALGEYGELIRGIKGSSDTDNKIVPLALRKRVKKQSKILNADILSITMKPYYLAGYEPVAAVAAASLEEL